MATSIREIIKESSIYDMKVLDNLDSVTDPTVNDDSTLGYSRKSTWYNQSTGEIYRCIDASAGAAVWSLTTLTVDDLGTAALADSVDFATAAQGSLADSSIQPGDNVSLLVNDSGFVDSTAISSAISLHEADANPHPQYFVTWAEYNNGANPSTAPEANFTDALALGNGAIAGATYAFSFLGSATGSSSIALGRNSASTGSGAIAIGQNSSSSSGVAIGSNADSTQNHAIALGNNTLANGASAIVIGNSITSAGICIGGAGAGSSCVTVGSNSQSNGSFSTAIGAYYARAEANYSTAVGSFANTQSKVGATALGYYAYCFDNGTVKLGAPSDNTGSFVGGIGSAGLSIAQRRTTGNTSASRNLGYIVLEVGKVYNVRVTVVAKQVGANVAWTRTAQVCVMRPSAGSAFLIGSQLDIFSAEDATFAGLTSLTLTANTSSLAVYASDSLAPSSEISMEYITVMDIVSSSSLAN